MTNVQLKAGNVPNLRFPGFEGEWVKRKLGEILTIGNGRDYKHLVGGDIPVYGTGGYMTAVNDFLYDGETVCIGRKGTINKPFYFSGKFWTVDTLFYTHSFKNVLPKFIFYTFLRINWLLFNEASGVPSLSKNTIQQIKVPITSIYEQQKIISFLSVIDEKIQTQNKIIEDLKLLKNLSSRKLFSRQLNFNKLNGSQFPEWERIKLREVLSIPDKIKPQYIDKNKLITVKLHLKGVFRNESTEALSIGATNYMVRKKGQFIYGKQNLFNGAFGIVPSELDGFLSSGDVPSLDIDHLKINPLFLLNFLGREYFYKQLENMATGSGSKRIHEETLQNIYIEAPCIEEQAKISSFFSVIDLKIDTEYRLLTKLKSQKKYLLTNLFI